MKALIVKLIKWIASLFVHETVEQVIEQAQKPSTITDENVPKNLRDNLDADLAAKLREGGSGNPS